MSNTYYVDVAVGDDANAGTSEGEGNAWETLAKAADTVVAGDKVYVKASGTYETEDGSNDCCAYLETAGNDESPIVWEGYASTPGDGGIVTINADPTGDQFSYCIKVDTGVSSLFNVFKNFVFTGSSSAAVYAGGMSDYLYFYNCRFTNNDGDGSYLDNYNVFLNCMFDNNDEGMNADANNTFIGCTAFGNSKNGFSLDTYFNVFIHCLAFGNTANYSNFTAQDRSVFVNCTTDGENELLNGILQSDSTSSVIHVVNSILYDNATGVGNYGDQCEIGIGFFNLYNSNLVDVDQFMPVSAGDGVGDRGDVSSSQTEGQLFVDASNAAALDRDYTPASGSDAIGAGMDASFCMKFWHSWDPDHGNSNPPSV